MTSWCANCTPKERHSPPTRRATMKKKIACVDMDMGQLRISLTAGCTTNAGCINCPAYRLKLNIPTPYDPAIPLLGMCPTERCVCVHRKTCTIAALWHWNLPVSGNY